jgi:hypothetical protein
MDEHGQDVLPPWMSTPLIVVGFMAHNNAPSRETGLFLTAREAIPAYKQLIPSDQRGDANEL